MPRAGSKCAICAVDDDGDDNDNDDDEEELEEEEEEENLFCSRGKGRRLMGSICAGDLFIISRARVYKEPWSAGCSRGRRIWKHHRSMAEREMEIEGGFCE